MPDMPHEAPTQFVEGGIRDATAGSADRRRPERFAELKPISSPTLVVNSHNDVMIPTINPHNPFRDTARAEVILSPDPGHGSLFQCADVFLSQPWLFVDGLDLCRAQ
jgi:pimeloyl-ACP methyl ester carboxylesterase